MTAAGTRGEPRRTGTEAAGSAFIQPFVDDGLENSAYLVGSRQGKVAVLIDPLRDVDPYLAAANHLGVRITRVLDTHLHNDFLSGAREVAAHIGVKIGASAEAGLEFEHRPLSDGDRLPLGELEIGVMSTPGHTPEHISFTLDGAGRDPRSVPLLERPGVRGRAGRRGAFRGHAWPRRPHASHGGADVFLRRDCVGRGAGDPGSRSYGGACARVDSLKPSVSRRNPPLVRNA